jgi:hypothetical protein
MSAADAMDPQHITPTFSAAAAIAVESRLTRIEVLLFAPFDPRIPGPRRLLLVPRR